MVEFQLDLLKFSEEEQACCLELFELHRDDSLQVFNFALISLVVEVQCHASQRVRYGFDRINQIGLIMPIPGSVFLCRNSNEKCLDWI